jgi:hypothetical protein
MEGSDRDLISGVIPTYVLKNGGKSQTSSQKESEYKAECPATKNVNCNGLISIR